MLRIIVDIDFYAERRLQAIDKGRNRAVPLASHRAGLASDEELHRDLRPSPVGYSFVTQELDWSISREVSGGKRLPHVAGADFRTGVLGDGLDGLGEFNLQAARQDHAVLRLHDIG